MRCADGLPWSRALLCRNEIAWTHLVDQDDALRRPLTRVVVHLLARLHDEATGAEFDRLVAVIRVNPGSLNGDTVVGVRVAVTAGLEAGGHFEVHRVFHRLRAIAPEHCDLKWVVGRIRLPLDRRERGVHRRSLPGFNSVGGCNGQEKNDRDPQFASSRSVHRTPPLCAWSASSHDATFSQGRIMMRSVWASRPTMKTWAPTSTNEHLR